MATQTSKLVLALLSLTGACYRGVDTQASGAADGGGSDAGESGAEDPYCEADAMPGPMTQFVRLTHGQYDNTVRDLLGVQDRPSAAFLADTAVKGFTNNADQLVVNDRLARDYRRAAEAIAADLLADTPRLSGVVGCEPAADPMPCVDEFIDRFGRRAFRRPITADEHAAFVDIYARGAGLYEGGTAFEQGIALVIETMLQAPSFLYRVELSTPGPDDAVVALDGWEIAARLSYMLWNSMPDDALLDAAEAGELDDAAGIEAHARRLLADARAADPVQDFHSQWLRMDRYSNISKDPDLFPDFDAETPASMAAETREFFRSLILEQDATFADLMTSRSTFVDDRLARIYGLAGSFGDTLTPVEVDPATRAGFLTHPGFLAANAYFGESSPIHRGTFVQRQVLCTEIPDPPPGVDLQLPPADENIRTTRQRVEQHTSPEQCAPCHAMINAPGYAFENFDAMGTLRSVDNGEPVDTVASFTNPDGTAMSFTGAVDMIEQLATSDVAKRCYSTQWFRYASARAETSADTCTLDGLHEAMLAQDYDVQELLVALTQTASFRFRAAQGGE